MSKQFNDAQWLVTEQYNNVDKLAARIRLHEGFSTGTVDIHHWFFDHLLARAPQQAVILEVGTGRGDIWKKNAERIPADWQIMLTDLSAGMLEDCKAHLGDLLAGRFAYDILNAEDIPYADGLYDVVIANFMLYHVPDRSRALAHMRRVLKPGGVLLAMTNGDAHMLDLLNLASRYDTSGTFEAERATTLFHETFSLENGGAQLAEYFADVQMERLPKNDLYVTEAQPLLDYVATMICLPGEAIMSENGQAITSEIEQTIARDGGLTIRKASGLFIAR